VNANGECLAEVFLEIRLVEPVHIRPGSRG
jgi:hypothetical protein